VNTATPLLHKASRSLPALKTPGKNTPPGSKKPSLPSQDPKNRCRPKGGIWTGITELSAHYLSFSVQKVTGLIIRLSYYMNLVCPFGWMRQPKSMATFLPLILLIYCPASPFRILSRSHSENGMRRAALRLL
jgi:hypothetical protein